MPQDNREYLSTETAIEVGQLVYTSFQQFGFSLLQSLDTPKLLQQSFIDKVVNARWDPHSPPSADYRAVYVYRVLGEFPHTVFGWLYYDGQDDFGRSGVPYFLAYHHQGDMTLEHLHLFLGCLAKGPIKSISRNLQVLEVLESVELDAALGYEPERLGVDIPDQIIQKSQQSLLNQTPIDWFISQTSSTGTEPQIQVFDSPVPEIILPDFSEDASKQGLTLANDLPLVSAPLEEAPALTDNSVIAVQQAPEEIERAAKILEGFVNKTMGIQGIALVSEEGQPIVSAMGLRDDSIEMLAGSMLYMTQISRQELEWPICDAVTLRGEDNFLMLKTFDSGIFLLIKSAKVPMGLLEGVVKRMINKLREELSVHDFIAVSSRTIRQSSASESPAPSTSTPTASEVSELLKAVLKNESSSLPSNDDLDDDITYRGRPTSS